MNHDSIKSNLKKINTIGNSTANCYCGEPSRQSWMGNVACSNEHMAQSVASSCLKKHVENGSK